jgi:hypothetical protein
MHRVLHRPHDALAVGEPRAELVVRLEAPVEARADGVHRLTFVQ